MLPLLQSTHPVTVEQWADVKAALASMLVLVIGALGIALVALIKRGRDVAAAWIEAKAANQTANEAKIQAAVATVTAKNADERAGRNAARTDTLMLATPPPGTGSGTITPTPTPTPGNGGKVFTALLPIMLLIGAAGCQTSQAKRLAIANDTFASTLDVLSDAREAGKIDDKTQREIVAPARRTIDALLDVAYVAVERGERLRLHQILAEIDRELTPLLQQRFKIKREEN